MSTFAFMTRFVEKSLIEYLTLRPLQRKVEKTEIHPLTGCCAYSGLIV